MTTLTELRDQLRVWSGKQDIPDSQLNHFVRLCEQDFKDDLFLPPNETIVILTTDADGRIAIPNDYLKTKHMSVVTSEGDVKPLYRKPNEFVVAGGTLVSNNGASYFERSGNEFIFAPAAGEGTDITLTYYSVIPSMVDIDVAEPGGANFVMQVMSTIYLFGSLTFLHAFTQEPEKAEYFSALFEKAKNDLIEMQEAAEMSGSSLHVVPTLSDDGSIW